MAARWISALLAIAALTACASAPTPAAPPRPASDAQPPASAPTPESAPALAAWPIDRLPESFPHGGEPRRAEDIDLIVLHTVGGATCKDGTAVFTPAQGSAVFWRDWFLGQSGKSIHYVVGREGDIAQQRPDLRTAGHVSFHGIVANVNQRAIGIELVNRGDGIEPFPEEQIAAVTWLVADLAARYALPPEAVVTHAALDDRMQPDCGGAPLRRNVDPGPLFPLSAVRDAVILRTEAAPHRPPAIADASP